jgi:hypothetical protein
VQVILRALKKYGMILADNGSSWYISGVPDSRWDDDMLVGELALVKGSRLRGGRHHQLRARTNSGAMGVIDERDRRRVLATPSSTTTS